MTVNAAVLLRDMLGNQFLLADEIVKEMEKHIEIERDNGGFHRDPGLKQ